MMKHLGNEEGTIKQFVDKESAVQNTQNIQNKQENTKIEEILDNFTEQQTEKQRLKI